MLNDNPTIDVREGEELDAAAVDACLKARIPGLEGQPAIRQFPSGASNLTYSISYANRELVLRRPPSGTKPRSGHDMHREFRVMNSLKPAYPAVPGTWFHTDDTSIIGAEFYVMDRVPGVLVKEEIPAAFGFGEEETRQLCLAFWDKLIELHQVDFESLGLGDYGRPEGYIGRQIHGWNKRYEKALTPDVSDFREVRDWLETNLPDKENAAAIVHGDYRLDNVILDRDDPFRIVAVLDWEISALGDPLMDLGGALAYWVQADDPPYMQKFRMQPSDAPGMLTRREILDHYQEKTGLDTSDFGFYEVYGYFRIAVILQQIYYRYHHGQTQDERFARFRDGVEAFGTHCRRLIGSA